MKLQKVKVAIFDLDGTLLDTIADIGTGANTALCRYGFPAYPIEEYRAMVGHGIRNLLGIAAKTATEQQLDQILKAYQGYYPEHCTDFTTYFPGVKELLSAMEAAGIRLAVISNKTETTSHKIISHFFPDHHFAFVWGNNGSRPLKPALEAGYLACEVLQVQPEEVLFVGDGDTDMEFASRMGFTAAGVTWGYRSAEELKAAGADFLVNSFEELASLLELN